MNMTDYELYIKYNTLGKYSKMKTRKFCDIRQPSDPPPGPPPPSCPILQRKK